LAKISILSVVYMVLAIAVFPSFSTGLMDHPRFFGCPASKKSRITLKNQ